MVQLDSLMCLQLVCCLFTAIPDFLFIGKGPKSTFTLSPPKMPCCCTRNPISKRNSPPVIRVTTSPPNPLRLAISEQFFHQQQTYKCWLPCLSISHSRMSLSYFNSYTNCNNICIYKIYIWYIYIYHICVSQNSTTYPSLFLDKE